MEVSYNYVQSRSSALEAFGSYSSTTGPAYIFRNTFVGDVEILMNLKASLTYNVIINNSSATNKITVPSNASNVSAANNLVGTTASSIIDGNGKLASGYLNYLGTTGWETGTAKNPPKAPTNIRVVVE